jgi:hypothetical protein
VTGLGLAAVLLAPSAVSASTPATQYAARRVDSPDPQPSGRWGERTASAGDLNRDGVPDIWVGDPGYDAGQLAESGRVYALSGRSLRFGATPQVLYVINPPRPQADAHFAFFIQNVGDVNGDNRDDIAVGTDAQDVGANVDQGMAWLFSGANGHLLRTFNNPRPQAFARFGSRIGNAGDLTGDGVNEIIIGASSNDVPTGCGQVSPLPANCHVDQGQAFIFNGKTGALFRTLNLPAADQSAAPCSGGCGSFGISVQGPGDTNGDGVPDQLVDAGSAGGGKGVMYVFSGKNGALLLRITDPEPANDEGFFGFQDVAPRSPGDVNGDGFADLYGNGFLQDGPAGPGQGKAWVFSGKTGKVLYALNDPNPQPGGQFGFSMAKTDYNKDGTPDLYVGSSPHHVAAALGSGGTAVFNGKNGAVLKSLPLPAADVQPSTDTDLGPNLGWTVSAPGDLNGDGNPDYIAGAPFLDVGGNQDQGRVYAFLSK